MNTIPTPLEAFRVQVKNSPDRTFLRQPIDGQWLEISWLETENRVMRVAQFLHDKGIKPSDRVAILSKNCAEWFIADLAIMTIGAVSVPLYPTQSLATTHYILDHCEAKLMFVGKLDEYYDLKQAGITTPIVEFPYRSNFDPQGEWIRVAEQGQKLKKNLDWPEEQLASIIYTSGTTGLPKGVMHSFKSMAYAAYHFSDHLEFNSQDRFLSYLPLSHIAERALVELASIYSGGTVSFVESMDTFAENLADVSPTIFFSVPRLWQKFHDAVHDKLPASRLNKLLKVPIISRLIAKKIRKSLGLNNGKAIGSGAAPIAPELLRWYQKIGINITEGYGQTESMGYTCVNDKNKIKIGTVGVALPGCKLRISAEGELLVKCGSNMIGYYKDPAATKQVFCDGYIRTGDLVSMDGENYLQVTGRVKDIFKTDKGKYVAPAPIEHQFVPNSHIDQLCIVGNGHPQPVALVVPSENARRLPREALEGEFLQLRDKINRNLGSHEKISRMLLVKEPWTLEAGFLTPTLKLKRHVVEERYEHLLRKADEKSHPIFWET